MNNIIRDAFNNCKPEQWLPYGDSRYVPLTKRGVRGVDGDIMRQIRTEIIASDEATQLLVSGFTGSGKTTELQRLAHDLQQDGFSVVYIDAEDYLNLRMPATVSDLWISIAAGFDRFLENIQGVKYNVGRFWERISDFLNREVEVSGLRLKVPTVVELTTSLKDNPAFRVALNDALAEKRPALVGECKEFLSEGLAALRKAHKDSSGTVLIIDSFEKVRGDARTAEEVRISVETLFTRDWRLLQTPCNAVFTVPPWLAFTDAGASSHLGRTRILPMCKVRERNGDPCGAGIGALFEILGERMDLEGIFGDRNLIQPLVEKSGGYPRDLLRMIREVFLRNAEAKSLPLDSEKVKSDVDRVLQIWSGMFEQGLAGEDIPLLVEVAEDRDITEWSREQKFRLAELFENHFVLSYQNGQPWWDLHPSLRDTPSMRRALERSTERKTQDRSSTEES